MGDKKKIKDLRRKIEALVMAIPRELESYDFYMEAASGYEEAISRDMFVFLAKQELAHKESLETLLFDLQAQLEEEMKK